MLTLVMLTLQLNLPVQLPVSVHVPATISQACIVVVEPLAGPEDESIPREHPRDLGDGSEGTGIIPNAQACGACLQLGMASRDPTTPRPVQAGVPMARGKANM